MKKFLLLLIVLVSEFVNAQLPENFDKQVAELASDLEFRRQLSGYSPDENVVFEPVLKKILNHTLNIDSLLSVQPQIYRIPVYENSTGNESESALSYLTRISFDSYKDNSKFNIEYNTFELEKGDRTETLVITRVSDSSEVLFVHIQFETYSNLIYSIITN